MTQKNHFHFLIYLGGLSIIGLLATDMYLPAFDQMRADLGTTKTMIGASLTLYLGGYALAQLLWGPVSDRIGKPKAIMVGLFIFVAASLGLFFTQNVMALLAFRLVQAVGACAAAVSWQALVIERYPQSQTNKIFASIMPLVALSPALAPIAGVYVLKHFGWPYIFLIVALLAAGLMVYTWFLKDHKNETSYTKAPEISYFDFLKKRKYIGNVMLYATCSAGFFAWLTGAPFFLKELGYDEEAIGLSFVPQTITFMLGGYGYRLLASKIDGLKLQPYLLTGYGICMLTLLFMGIFMTPTMTELLIPFSIMAMMNGASYPIAVAEALKPFPENSGKASALLNALQLGACFLASAAVSLFSGAALLATCVVMAVTVIFVVIGYRMTK